ncbi:MAG: PilC/PilY family type IV pilus protein [Betaproteobacteria bacterium]|nr:PilC/PilY family type IV pilus protein [Betaproteobacteria bacterium]
MKKSFTRKFPWAIAPAFLCYSAISTAVVTVEEDFTKSTTQNRWQMPKTSGGTGPNMACLTAGTSGSVNTVTVGSPPACNSSGYSYPNIKEADGKGALRLTPALNQMAGGIVSDFTFPTNEGVQISFTTYSYGSTTYTWSDKMKGNIGADGIAFFLTDGAQPVSLGARGGSLGYSCSNQTNPTRGYQGEGIIGGYLGLGMDEWGNFLNSGDNTNTGSYGLVNTIGMRGAGSVNWKTLNSKYPSYYPSSGVSWGLGEQDEGIRRTCQTGTIHKYNKTSKMWEQSSEKVQYNYPELSGASTFLPISMPLSNPDAKTRDRATPINYKLRITKGGLLSLWWSYNGGIYQPVLIDKNISSANGPMPDSFRFGFSSSTGDYNNIHEITCFKAAPASHSEGSAAISLPNNEYKTGAQIYISMYNPGNWSSQLMANNLVYQKATGKVSVNPVSNWDASCVLTGGPCNSTGGKSVTAQATDSRAILAHNGTQGIPLRWDNLSTEQKSALNLGDNRGELRLQYLRGDRRNEQTSSGSGLFRARASVLGDIINSGPAWVGPPSIYADKGAWTDALNPDLPQPENSGQAYADFKRGLNTRLNVVYAASNDGLLHGFRSGAYDSTGSQYQTDLNDGREVLAYMPGSVLKVIHNNNAAGMDFSNVNYGHNYFNDATPGTGDLFYGGTWHTWLVGGLGAGGSTIYALDITDPSSFSEANAGSLVVGEWAYNANDPVWKTLGNTYGTPVIRRFHNGQWGAVFGNGWCLPNDVKNGNCRATSGEAGIYVMLVDDAGKPSFRFLGTGSGTTASPNGIAYTTAVDLDGDNIADYVYAGDLLGNIWRFDISSSNSSLWGSGGSVTKIFTALVNQPITTRIMVSATRASSGGAPRIMLNFGTGQQIPSYLSTAELNSKAAQTLYGIWDWDMSQWNAKKSAQYASLDSGEKPVNRTSLVQQTIDSKTNALSNNSVCWAGQASCSGTANRYGWYMNLETYSSGYLTVYEQLIYNPILSAGAVFFSTMVPGVDNTASCNTTLATGFTYALNPETGGGIAGLYTNNFNDTSGYRLPLNATGAPSMISVEGRWFLITKDASGKVTPTEVFLRASEKSSKRVNWIQLR